MAFIETNGDNFRLLRPYHGQDDQRGEGKEEPGFEEETGLDVEKINPEGL